jgi:hypothetical protein
MLLAERAKLAVHHICNFGLIDQFVYFALVQSDS